MLANVPPPGRDFHGLTRYLLLGSGGRHATPDRVQWTRVRNLATDQPFTAAMIMTATAHNSIRVELPVYHLIMSWTPEENPSALDMETAVDRVLADVGLGQHQALLVAHGDTQNRHVHAIVNRIAPDTGRAWSTSHDYRRIERSVAVHAGAMGFSVVPGRHNGGGAATPHVRSRGAMMRARRDTSVLMPWSRARVDAVKPLLSGLLACAGSWDGLAAAFHGHGYALERKGQGLIVQDHAKTGYVKLSALGVRLPELTRRLGVFAKPPTWTEHKAEVDASSEPELSR